MSSNFGIAIHGGAGTIVKMLLTEKMENEYQVKLKESLKAGFDVLNKGGASLEAVQAAIVVMEDSPLFNAGKGAVFTNEGTNEQDASIMCGKTLNCGAVAGVTKIKNPIRLVSIVMEKSEHVCLSGTGAERFAKMHKVDFADAEYFYTDRRWEQLQKAKKKEAVNGSDYSQLDHSDDTKHGTVGAVALDKDGNLVAATSSGGMTNKKFNRIGDSPIIGAGNYANNKTCAVSTTGHGEYFMRGVSAYDLSALMEYKNMNLKDASDEVIRKLGELGGTGGLIAIDSECNVVLPFNTSGMYRGYKLGDSSFEIGVYKD
ncbi:MAG: isoaspartyl peptidase/L-asparaginase [candidate division Zixibacteria bacterium]|nr:isoaspartyl peptidase/L-asparaginase [candidate division Zixibacteria bacterium]